MGRRPTNHRALRHTRAALSPWAEATAPMRLLCVTVWVAPGSAAYKANALGLVSLGQGWSLPELHTARPRPQRKVLLLRDDRQLALAVLALPSLAERGVTA